MSTAQRPIQSPRGAGMVWVSDLITYWEAGSCAKQTCAPTVSGQRVHPAGLYITHRCSVSLFNKQRARARSLSLHSLAVPRSQDTSSSTLRHRVLARSRSRALPATPRPGSSLSLSCTLTSSHPNRGQQRATQALHVVTPTTAFISSLTRQAACAHAISCRLALRMMMDGCVLCTRAVSCECVSHTQELMHASHARTHARTHARRADTQERQTATELSA